jgi:hypothetical protein
MTSRKFYVNNILIKLRKPIGTPSIVIADLKTGKLQFNIKDKEVTLISKIEGINDEIIDSLKKLIVHYFVVHPPYNRKKKPD